MDKKYFILHSGEDGVSVEHVSEKDMLAAITPNEDGCTDYGEQVNFLTEMPSEFKGNWEADQNSILIIKGEIVIPKPIKVVTKFEL